MKKIPTAKSFIESTIEENNYDTNIDIEDAMIEFTKLHVEEALKKAASLVDEELEKDFITGELILASYPLKNIK
jgi:hypothetical protein